MTRIDVGTPSRSYSVVLGESLLERAGEIIKEERAGSRYAIVTDSTVGPIYAEKIRVALEHAGLDGIIILVPAGENAKCLEQAGLICDQMIAAGLDRRSFVIGLGGGVIGDLSGFVAAIYQRGIPHIQIPTTLLAMVDSSIGGKTGVNTASGKNLLGAVHQPSLVIDDIDVLQTLPPRELNQGFAEIIKHAIIADREMFADLQGRKPGDAIDFQTLVRRNIEIKARFVREDERDRNGQRALLNFGHTIGHAIESAGDYRTFLHGEAVSLGIVAATRISVKRAGLSQSANQSVEELLRKFSLPTKLQNNISRERILASVRGDKKFEEGAVRFVLTSGIGSALLSSEVEMGDIEEAIEEL